MHCPFVSVQWTEALPVALLGEAETAETAAAAAVAAGEALQLEVS